MPSFERMKKYHSSTSEATVLGEQLKEMSNYIVDETFQNGTSYRIGKIYDCNMKELNNGLPLEFKFLKTKTYTMEKDAVEYMVQFRPGINPEINFDNSDDKKHRLSFYLDIKDENTKLIEKWLIVGKDEAEFDKYNVLKCNWTFEWLDENRVYRSCLGCIRDRNSYTSGIWSDGFSTTVTNETAFILPSNNITKSIDYGARFMITDNEKHPKTYKITKVADTFPLGNIKFVLTQSHYNEHTDLCGTDSFFTDKGDKSIHMICDYFKSTLPPVEGKEMDNIEVINQVEKNIISWKIEGGTSKLKIKGKPILLQAVPDKQSRFDCEWVIKVDGTIYSIDELKDYFDIVNDDDKPDIFTIKAINKVMAKYIVSIELHNSFSGTDIICDSVEMEVVI